MNFANDDFDGNHVYLNQNCFRTRLIQVFYFVSHQGFDSFGNKSGGPMRGGPMRGGSMRGGPMRGGGMRGGRGGYRSSGPYGGMFFLSAIRIYLSDLTHYALKVDLAVAVVAAAI